LIRAGIEVEMIQLRNRAAAGDLTEADRADIELRLKLLLAHAKLRGWIVDRKQIARASIDLGRLGLENMHAEIGPFLDALEPGARREIELRVKALDERRSRLKSALGPAVAAHAAVLTEASAAIPASCAPRSPAPPNAGLYAHVSTNDQ
jgi:hypothetical protein